MDMYGSISHVIKDKIDLSIKEGGENKVMGLKDAVRLFIHGGMHIHIGHSYLRPNAAVYEICRAFWGKDPRFVISSLGFTANMVLFVYGRLAKRLITTFCGDAYPFPGPNRVYQEAYREGSLAIENWTVLTLTQRLLAGALGVEWMPTHSLAGSSLVEENARDLWVGSSPEGKGQIMVRALRPDLTILHAWAADSQGNVLLAPPYAEGPHGVFASRQGAVVTVETVLSTEELKRYSHFVKIPGYLVRAVCPVPLGAHPAGASNHHLKDFEPYAEDEDFIRELRDACGDEARLQKWTEEWLLGCEDHTAYLRKLGHKRIWFLKGRSAADSWSSELSDQVGDLGRNEGPTPVEMMIVAAARVIKEKMKSNDYRTILAGIGASNLAAWKAWFDLRREDHPADLMAEVGFFGYTPRPADPFIFNFRNIPTCTMLTDILTVLGSLVGAESNRCLGVLGAGQIDRHGNVNSTLIPEYKLFLVGSGGACDVALGAKEVIVTMAMNELRLVEKVGYITAPGDRVRTLVTDKGIFEKIDGKDTFELTSFYGEERDGRDRVEEIKSNCGWKLVVSPQVCVLEPPTLQELIDIRIFDPRRHFLAG